MALSVRRRLVNVLDRPGGRKLLGGVAKKLWAPDTGVDVIYDGMWIDVVDGVCIPRSKHFSYWSWDFEHMRERCRSRLESSVDYWTHVYKPKEGDTIVDIGAGVGVDVIALSPLIGRTGHIYALEAHPWTAAACAKAVELNRIENVTTCALALADKPGELFISDGDNDEANTVTESRGDGHCVSVRAVDLDTFVTEHKIKRIDLLKMNIEGAEGLAIQGMRKSIGLVNHAVIACHDFRGDVGGTKDTVVEFLKESGFTITERSNDHREYVRDHIHGKRG